MGAFITLDANDCRAALERIVWFRTVMSGVEEMRLEGEIMGSFEHQPKELSICSDGDEK